MVQQIELLPVRDFTGGLNVRANPLQLLGSESPDMLNVDVDPRGGMFMRNTVKRINTTQLGTDPQSIFSHSTTTGTKQVLVTRSSGAPDCEVLSSTGGNFTAIATPAAHTTAGVHRATTFEDITYIQNGVNKAMTYNGAALAELTDPVVGGTWDPDFAAPTTGEMPIGKCIVTHQGSVWVANTLENGTAWPNRVRWSHPAHAQAWRSQDFIDIDTGHDGDVITAIVSFAERLYVFKNKSIHVISGYSPSNFQVSTLTMKVGAPSQEAVCLSEDSIYFFSWPSGAYRYQSGGGLEWIFERLYPEIQDGKVLGAFTSSICLGWMNRRLWISVVYNSGSTNNRVYVYDPTLWGPHLRGRRTTRPQGAWVQYDMTIGPMLAWGPPGSTTKWLACSVGKQTVVELEVAGDQDNYAQVAAVEQMTNIPSYYVTRWEDLDNPAQFKRWRRPEFIMSRAHTSVLSVQVFKDYDPATATATFALTPTAGNSTGTSLWGANWGTMIWGSALEADGVQLQKGHAMGRCRSVALKINGPTPSVRWAIDGVTLKYVPLRIR